MDTHLFPGDLSIADFDYHLPKEKIAFFPLSNRDEAKMLVYNKGELQDSNFYSISEFLPAGSLMVFNESKVVQARLTFVQADGSAIELFCLESAEAGKEITTALQVVGSVTWKCLVGDLRKWKEKVLYMDVTTEEGKAVTLQAELVDKDLDAFNIQFTWDSEEVSFGDLLRLAGNVPLPPYIKRQVEETDKERYQTIYARKQGSVAAPTAGLHFTPRVFDTLKSKKIDLDYVTLHVGAGTFKPVKTATINDHHMHAEPVVLTRQFLEKLLAHVESDIVAVGTTTVRTLESLYWLGVRLHSEKFGNGSDLSVGQWDPYSLNVALTTRQAIQAILTYLDGQPSDVLIFRTSIIIAPGYQWKLVNVMATNFHQPKSTLMLLVAAFVGENWRGLYRHALENHYRFLSFGDGALLFRNEAPMGSSFVGNDENSNRGFGEQ